MSIMDNLFQLLISLCPSVNPESLQKLLPVVKSFHQYKNSICMVEFTTLAEYLLLLREASISLQVCGSRAMLYLAAAVSDFYIPHCEMVGALKLQHLR